MNEQIKQIAEEHFSVMPDEIELMEFAGSIARLCATMCNIVSGYQIDGVSAEYQHGREQGAIACKNLIMNYLGNLK